MRSFQRYVSFDP